MPLDSHISTCRIYNVEELGHVCIILVLLYTGFGTGHGREALGRMSFEVSINQPYAGRVDAPQVRELYYLQALYIKIRNHVQFSICLWQASDLFMT